MKHAFKRIAAVALALFVLAPATGFAGNRATVEAFYTKVLSGSGSADMPKHAKAILADDWQSIGGYKGPAKTRDKFIGQMAGFGKLIPGLTWKVEEILQQGNRFVVRGRATGMPKGPFFGVEPTGKSFEIMSIDIHTVEKGKIVKTYHVEDWAGAIRQLKAK